MAPNGTLNRLRIGLAVIAVVCITLQSQLQSQLQWQSHVNTQNFDLPQYNVNNRTSSDPEPIQDRPEDDLAIRQWGCAPRNETPFIFVHIGKAGGGSVRARMAAAALQYNRSAWYRTHEDPQYYYPVYDGQGHLHRGKFHFSTLANWIPQALPAFWDTFTYEGFGFCGATTPLGAMIACPHDQRNAVCQDKDNDTTSDARCDIVYMGHNVIGSELHWLPTEFLVDWWKNSPWGQLPQHKFIGYAIRDRHMAIANQWHVQEEIKEIVGADNIPTIKCDKGPYRYRYLKRNYKTCFQPKEVVLDQVYHHIMGKDPLQAARMTASLPSLRVTVLREPFSWLISKFFWHPEHYSKDDVLVAPDAGEKNNQRRIQAYEKKNKQPPGKFIQCDDTEEAATGWVRNRALSYMFYLCGEHCMGGWAAGTLSLEDLEQQAAYNLRHSFVVVGLLHKSDEFYQMVTDRVYYMNTSLNPHVSGKSNKSSQHTEARRCKTIFQTVPFQEELLSKSPELRALARLYNIAEQVNEFQKQELAECGHVISPTATSEA